MVNGLSIKTFIFSAFNYNQFTQIVTNFIRTNSNLRSGKWNFSPTSKTFYQKTNMRKTSR